MFRGLTKDVTAIILESRALPVIETFWEDYPCYFETVNPFAILDDNGNVRKLFKGDCIIWDKDDNLRFMQRNVWNKVFGEYLKTHLKTKEISVGGIKE